MIFLTLYTVLLKDGFSIYRMVYWEKLYYKYGHLDICIIKVAVSRDFFISLIQPIWTPEKQVKMFPLLNLFLRRYSNFQFEKFDSAQAITARSRNFLTSQPIKKLTKMLGYIEIILIFKKKKIFFFIKATRGLQRKNCCRQNSAQCWPTLDLCNFFEKSSCFSQIFIKKESFTPCRVSLHGVDSVQCQPTQSPTPRSVSLRGVTYFANISAKTNFKEKPC